MADILSRPQCVNHGIVVTSRDVMEGELRLTRFHIIVWSWNANTIAYWKYIDRIQWERWNAFS